MFAITIGGDAVDLRPFAEEAVRHFGFVQPGAADWLAAAIAITHTLNNGRTIRENGTPIPPGDRATHGIPLHASVSVEVWDALTETGRVDPVARFDATCTRALQRARGHAQAERYRRMARIFAGVKISAGTAACPPCAASAPLDGQHVNDPIIFPLPRCDRLVCACSWRPVTAWEKRRPK